MSDAGPSGRHSLVRRLLTPRWALPLLLFLGACASDAPQDTLEPKGPIARTIDNLVNPVFLVAGVVFVLVEGGMLVLLRKFRRRQDDDDSELPPQVHGNLRLEWGWTVVPFLILVGVAVPTVMTVFAIDAKADDATMTVQVTGQQWWWEFRYDTNNDNKPDIITANDLVVPAGETIRLEIRSNDVIHSFWIPALNGKKDAVPGRVQELTVEADDPGTFVGQCTEFCGLSHAYMRQRLVALSRSDFDSWAANQREAAKMPTSGDAAAGAELFKGVCSTCHLARGINDDDFAAKMDEQGGRALLESGVAPDLTHFATRGAFAGAIFNLWTDTNGDDIVEWNEIGQPGAFNTNQLKAWLRDPPAEKPMHAVLESPHSRGMPNYNLTEEQIDQLAAFFETLD